MDDATREEIRNEIQQQLGELGSLFTVGQPAAVGLATMTGFGMVETEKNEGAPVVLNAASVYRTTAVADVPNNTGAYLSTTLSFPVVAGAFYQVHAQLWVGNTGAVAGGINLKLTGPIAAALTAVVGTNAAGTGVTPFQSLTNAPIGPTCVQDTSGGGATQAIFGAFVAASANGIVTLEFVNAVGGQNWIVRGGSFLYAIRN